MASILFTLTLNLITPDFGKFRETRKMINNEDIPLVTRKGVYPYEYTDSWGKLEENTLPRKEEFYSTLTETNIGDTDYEHAKTVWTHFDCRMLGEYSDLYLKIDVMLLVDVFKNCVHK
ncbi:Ribonuclease H-like domain [Cinara cedri]|uniref:Ribonuclease H-like domain n=1 Tax=Cinara cedri TaxID=506608 RepID=A0A5E4M5D0_9HEMI|nr:Ribonuclease H-like domain [Cinara cedri]